MALCSPLHYRSVSRKLMFSVELQFLKAGQLEAQSWEVYRAMGGSPRQLTGHTLRIQYPASNFCSSVVSVAKSCRQWSDGHCNLKQAHLHA